MANTRVTRPADALVDRRMALPPHSDAPPPPLQEPLAGYIFVCNNETMEDDLKRELFGLPQKHHESVRNIQSGMPIFLYNYTVHQLHGVFEACSDGGLNIDPTAAKFPAQVRVRLREKFAPLEETRFRPFLYHYDGPKFRLELSQSEANALLKLFEDSQKKTEEEVEGDWETVKPKSRGVVRNQHTSGTAFFRNKRPSAPNQAWRAPGQQHTQPTAAPISKGAPVPSAASSGSLSAPPPPPPPPVKRSTGEAPSGTAAPAVAWSRPPNGQESDAWSKSSGSSMVSQDLSTTGTSSEDRSIGGDQEPMAECNGTHEDAVGSDAGSSTGHEREGDDARVPQQDAPAEGPAENDRKEDRPGEKDGKAASQVTPGEVIGSSRSMGSSSTWAVRSDNVSFAAVLRRGHSEEPSLTKSRSASSGLQQQDGQGLGSDSSGPGADLPLQGLSAPASTPPPSVDRVPAVAGVSDTPGKLVERSQPVAGASAAATGSGPVQGPAAVVVAASAGDSQGQKDVALRATASISSLNAGMGAAPKMEDDSQEGWITVSATSRAGAGGRGPAAAAAQRVRTHTADASDEVGRPGRGTGRKLADFGGLSDKLSSPGQVRGRGGGTGPLQRGTQQHQDAGESRKKAGDVDAIPGAASPGVSARAAAEGGRSEGAAVELKPRRLAWQGADSTAVLIGLAGPQARASSAAAVSAKRHPQATVAADTPNGVDAPASAKGSNVAAKISSADSAVEKEFPVAASPAQSPARYVDVVGPPQVGASSKVAGGEQSNAEEQGKVLPVSGDGGLSQGGDSTSIDGKEASSVASAKGGQAGAAAAGKANARNHAIGHGQVRQHQGRLQHQQYQQLQQTPPRQQKSQDAKDQALPQQDQQPASASGAASTHQHHQHHSPWQKGAQQVASGAHSTSLANGSAAMMIHGTRGGPPGMYGRQGERGFRGRGRSHQDLPGRGSMGAYRSQRSQGLVEPIPPSMPLAYPLPAGSYVYPQLFHPGALPGQPPYLVPLVGPIAGYPAFPTPSANFLINAAGLHQEILEYAEEARPTREARLSAQQAVWWVQDAVKVLWGPETDVEVFGSYATGLALPYSDIDVAVVNAPPPPIDSPEVKNLSGARISAPLIRQLAKFLQKQPWCDSLYTIETARIPVIKLQCNAAYDPAAVLPSSPPPKPSNSNSPDSAQAPSDNSGDSQMIAEMVGLRAITPSPVPTTGVIGPARKEIVKMDITIALTRPHNFEIVDDATKQLAAKLDVAAGVHNGAPAREFVIERLKQYPALAPLVLLMKSYLHHRGLKDVYTGGLGSFSLTMMLVFYLERAPVASGGTRAPGPLLPVTYSGPFDPTLPFAHFPQQGQYAAAPALITTAAQGVAATPASLGGMDSGSSTIADATGGSTSSSSSSDNAGADSGKSTSSSSSLGTTDPVLIPALPVEKDVESSNADTSDVAVTTAEATVVEKVEIVESSIVQASSPLPAKEKPFADTAEPSEVDEAARPCTGRIDDSGSPRAAVLSADRRIQEGREEERTEGGAVGVSAAADISCAAAADLSPAAAADDSASAADLSAASAGSTELPGGQQQEHQSMECSRPKLAKGVVVDDLLASATSVPSPTLGALLLGFLHLFGQEIDLSKVKLMLRGKDGAPGGVYWQEPGAQPAALWVDDPLQPGSNIGSGSFAMWHVQAALREMLTILTSPALSAQVSASAEDTKAPSSGTDEKVEVDPTKERHHPNFPLLDAAFMLKLPVASVASMKH